MEFRLLGPLELVHGDVTVAPERPQERALLAGGTLTIESEGGQGSTVYLRLPIPEAEKQDA